MKYALISDVHANLRALKAVLADASANGAGEFVMLGDAVGYGPQPAEALALVRESCRTVLAGNHDDAVSGRMKADDFNGLASDAVARHREMLSRDALDYLSKLPHSAELEGAALCVHGDAVDPAKFYYISDEADAEANFNATDSRLVFCGHTHVPGIFVKGASGSVHGLPPQDFTLEDGKRYIVNCGSVGYPRETDGECRSTYVLYDSVIGTVEFRSLPFEVEGMLQRGRNPRRTGLLALIITAVVAMALAVVLACAFNSDKVTVVAGERPVAVKILDLPPDLARVNPAIELGKGSPAVKFVIDFTGLDGRLIKSEAGTVKRKMRAKGYAIPKGATKAEFRLYRTVGEPTIELFAPTASVR